MTPSPDQALQFAIMLQAGLPASDAIAYFIDLEDPAERARVLLTWLKSRSVRTAQQELMGKKWQDMNLDERCRYALDLHYSQMAYYLFNHNYVEMTSGDKTKADTARAALESKLAGNAGKGDALTRFLDDFTAAKKKSA